MELLGIDRDNGISLKFNSEDVTSLISFITGYPELLGPHSSDAVVITVNSFRRLLESVEQFLRSDMQ